MSLYGFLAYKDCIQNDLPLKFKVKLKWEGLNCGREASGGSRNYVYNDNKKELQLNKEISCCFYIGLSHVEKTSHWTLHILACSAHCFMMQAHE